MKYNFTTKQIQNIVWKSGDSNVILFQTKLEKGGNVGCIRIGMFLRIKNEVFLLSINRICKRLVHTKWHVIIYELYFVSPFLASYVSFRAIGHTEKQRKWFASFGLHFLLLSSQFQFMSFVFAHSTIQFPNRFWCILHFISRLNQVLSILALRNIPVHTQTHITLWNRLMFRSTF